MMVLLKSEMLDLLTDHLCLFECDLATGRITFASKPLERLLGYGVQGEAEGKRLDALAPGLLDQPWLDDPQTREAPAAFTRKDGSAMRAAVLLMPRATATGRVVVGRVREEGKTF